MDILPGLKNLDNREIALLHKEGTVTVKDLLLNIPDRAYQILSLLGRHPVTQS
jgi:hypothetical protein